MQKIRRTKENMKNVQIFFSKNSLITTSWGCWKHVFGIPGARPMFLKAEFHKESKNGFKTINFRRYPVMIFSKNCFRSKKIIKKIGRFDDFWTFMAMYMIKLHQFKKIAGSSESVEILPKYQKLISFFMWLFIFGNKCFLAIMATIELKHLIFKSKKLLMKKLISF